MKHLAAPVKGFKIFGSDWDCRDKQYTCPGEFVENVDLLGSDAGMHFCLELKDCFRSCTNNPNNHCAEVIAIGEVIQEGKKCKTNHLQLVREIPWDEVMKRVNQGKACTGICNTGDCNTGSYNSGNCNTGSWNAGKGNTGCWNSGDRNAGDMNSGDRNTGRWNSGNENTGDWNAGDHNTGRWNTGDYNVGEWNTGNHNTGNWNSGDHNTGDWNSASYSNGVFCTEEPEILIFDRPSGLTLRQWRKSEAYYLLNRVKFQPNVWILSCDMTDEEKVAHPEYKITGGYLKVQETTDCFARWWENLTKRERNIIRTIPNFDPAIFKQVTGIDA